MRHFTLAALTAIGLVAATPLLAQTPAPATSTQQKMAPPPAAAPTATAPASNKMAPATTGKASPAAHAKQELIDINHATEEQLSMLPGIAKARSEAIIKGRPYKGKDELVSKKIIPENVYKDIKDKIVAHQKG
ncbi:DNA-binding protein [Afipia sp. P52-10]|uniref:ComEA family DNA-binding protein n=1 Tax=Afipia sp. P52-10 TaxID=1429916 RepID=UPI0003DF25DA|nr:helix-hairpin-helix domain-containing protein [Afipia sp. P52-10]ETR77641.1 DNA-binding protein [Afipia sp. P52-10]